MANNNKARHPDETKTETIELGLVDAPVQQDEVKAPDETKTETIELGLVDEDAEIQMQLSEFAYLEKLNNTETAYLEMQFGYFPRAKKFWQSNLNIYRGVK